MKKTLPLLIVLVLVTLACNTPTPVVTTPPPIVTEPPVTTEAPVITAAPPVNVTCNEISIYLDPGVAAGYTCETVPESTMEMEIRPEYTKLTLQGYALSDRFFVPHISVFPVQGYTDLLPDFVPGRVAELQGLLAGTPPGDSLPFLPVFNAAQTFHAQYQVVPFVDGSGIRFLTLYAQYFAPINNHDLFYTYQALTADGQYWISAILPVSHPTLPENADNPPGGLTWEEFSNNYVPYITDLTSSLNAQDPASFAPSLALLDALAASITIQP
ncbi:MAG: hypothetical protein JXB85_07520 [Anaerolineales bacterium]|nr:hypothetical protein [Anaerolineales bacterium]